MAKKAPASTPSRAESQRDLRIFRALDRDGDGRVSCDEIVECLTTAGLRRGDPRIAGLLHRLDERLAREQPTLDPSEFVAVTEPASLLLEKVVEGRLIVPDFGDMCREIDEMYEAASERRDGEVATYIPQLGRADPEQFGLAVCTIDGQRHERGDSRVDFCLQSCCKPINYCVALEQLGQDEVGRHVGREPSGQGFNQITLDKNGRPHNPMINAGAIMCCALIDHGQAAADRFDGIMRTWQRLCADKVGFSNAVYLSERKTANRNFALGYFMQEHRCFPEGSDLIDTLEFYFQCCSIEATCDKLSVAAATLANGGVSPITGERIFSPQTVRDCLSLMLTCGMYDFSGEFAFSIGLPAKSGVSGAIMVVIPNVMGVTVWSPRLDGLGNSVRGLEVCRRITQTYNFHVYDSLTGVSPKKDPRLLATQLRARMTTEAIWAAALGDLATLRQLLGRGQSMAVTDYDQRTPLHLAATHGHAAVVAWLLRNGASASARDRWGRTPLDEAEFARHDGVARLLRGAKGAPGGA